MDKIQSSLDWQELRVQIEQKIRHLDYKIQKDLYIMLKNTDTCVGKLSIEEIQCRRYHKPTGKFLTKLEETNTMIADINKMITMGALL